MNSLQSIDNTGGGEQVIFPRIMLLCFIVCEYNNDWLYMKQHLKIKVVAVVDLVLPQTSPLARKRVW